MTGWLDPPGRTDGLADACQSDAEALGGRIREKRKLLKALWDHGRGKCPTAKLLRAQIADLVSQQKQWTDSAKRLQAEKPPVGSITNRTRSATSKPPRLL